MTVEGNDREWSELEAVALAMTVDYPKMDLSLHKLSTLLAEYSGVDPGVMKGAYTGDEQGREVWEKTKVAVSGLVAKRYVTLEPSTQVHNLEGIAEAFQRVKFWTMVSIES